MDEFRQRLQEALAPGYELERELGGGGMSRVFVATERALGRHVVVKVLSPELAAGVNAERFRREIQLAAQLHHPHIVPLLSAGEHGDLLYYTMPFIEGQSLRSALRDRGKLPLRDVVRMLHDVVDALAYAHARGIVHRDIKPDNILMHGAHALVTDFGVAKAISAALPIAGHTTTGMAIGTPAYMAPEQLAADPTADHRMDLYAVGLVAYELLTGGSPYSTTSPAELLAAQLTRTPPPLHEVVPEVPRALSAVIMSTLEKDPARRPATAEILLTHLDAVSTPQGGVIAGADTPASVISPATGPAERASATRGFRLGALAAAVGIIGIIGVSLAALRALDRAGGQAETTVQQGAPASVPAVDSSQLRAPPSATIAGAPNAPGDRVQPLVITREESLAIAAAVQERMLSEQRATQPSAGGQGERVGAAALGIAAAALEAIPSAVFAESLRAEINRIYADSISVALREFRELAEQERVDPRLLEPRAPATVRQFEAGRHVAPTLPRPAPNITRVIVTEMRGDARRGPLAELGEAVTDSLRARLDRHPHWQVVDEATMRRFEGADNVVALGFATRADVVISGALSARRDSVGVRLTFIDPRSRRVRQLQSAMRPLSEAPALASELATRAEEELMRALEEWQRGRREPERRDGR